jgi:hypothetical protein
MRCQEAAELMLEAVPAELAGEGDSPLAAHLRGCGRCAGVGARLLEGARVLGEVLASDRRARLHVGGDELDGVEAEFAVVRAGARRGMRGVEEALAEFEVRLRGPGGHAGRVASGDPAGTEPVVDDGGVRRPDPRWRRAAAVAMPLAAAASFALLLAPWRGGTSEEPLPLPVLKLAERTPVADVVVPAGHDAVLFRTSNPKITVVWIY